MAGTRTDRESLASPSAGERPAEWSFRPDIEGLRAVAILLVVLYHASIGPFAGGFVGVDVFYVLSGFLITGLLLRELSATGSISLPAFYARRARRLLPAAALVLVVTLVASALVLPPLLVPGVAADAAAAALYVANVRFAVQATDYFAAAQAPSPLLHYWSLGVEEQFYLLWPALVLAIAAGGRRPARRTARRIGLAALAIGLLSLAWSLWLTGVNAPPAFFLLPSRAWELLLGALLAVAGSRLASLPAPASAAAGWIGLGLIATAAVVMNDTTPYPGLAALLPTVGAALVVAGGARPTAAGPARPLGTAVPRFLGRISYSLYLWHWPLLLLPAAAVGAALALPARAALVLAAIGLAAATQRWIEDPIRRGRVVGMRPRRSLAMAGVLAATVIVAAVGTGLAASARLPGAASTASAARGSGPGSGAAGASSSSSATVSPTPLAGALASGGAGGGGGTSGGQVSVGPGLGASAPSDVGGTAPMAIPSLPPSPDEPVPSDLTPSLAAAPEDYPPTFADGCNVPEGGRASRGSCLYGDLGSTITIALFGDSHAAFWFPAVERFAEQEGWRLLNLTMSSCTPADLSVYNSIFKRIYSECPAWRALAIARMVAARPAVILVAGTHGITPVDSTGHLLTGQGLVQAWEDGMARTIERLAPYAGRVVLLADTPTAQHDPPTCLSAHPESILACATPVARAIDLPWLAAEHRVVQLTGAGFIDPTYWVCPSSPCPVVIGHVLLYQNAGHLSTTFAASLGGSLGAAILQQLRATASP